MSESPATDDRWDPPWLSRHYPFPPPVMSIDLDAVDTVPPILVALIGYEVYRGFRHDWWWQDWFVAVGTALIVCWVLEVLPHVFTRHRLHTWLRLYATHFLGWAACRAFLRPVPYRFKKHLSRWAYVVPRHVGSWLHADVRILDNGVLDISGGWGPFWLRWLFAAARRREAFVALLWVSNSGKIELLDAEARVGVWADRQELFIRPPFGFVLYVRARPIDTNLLRMAAGPVGDEAVEWGKTLFERRILMAVPAGRRGILEHRIIDLMGVSDEDPGRLGNAGVAAERITDREEARKVLADSWGQALRPALAIDRQTIAVETGTNDPAPIGHDPTQKVDSAPGVRKHVTYVVLGNGTQPPDTVGVGWLAPLTEGGLECDVAFHVRPVIPWYAHAQLGLKKAWWNSLTFGRGRYTRSMAQAERTMNLMHRRRTSTLQVGMYVTVAETQTNAAEAALDEMVGRGSYYLPSMQARQARASTEPTGRDQLQETFWTDSQTLGAGWPGTGGIYTPGGILLGKCPGSNEIVVWDPFWEGDETSLGLILGRTGSGKTNLEMAIANRARLPHPDHWLAKFPPPVVVAYLKPWDEWKAFCDFHHGKHYHLGAKTWRAMLADAGPDVPVVAFNIIDLPDIEQVKFMSALEHYVEARQKPHNFTRPLMYIIGEGWAWAQDPAMAKHVQKYALQVRALMVGLLFDTQHPHHVFETALVDLPLSASMWCAMKLHTSERHLLARTVDLGAEAMKFLAQLDRPNTLTGTRASIKGRGIIEAHGVRTKLQVARLGFEQALLDQTNPRRRAQAWRELERAGYLNGHSPVDIALGKLETVAGSVPN